MDAGSQYLKGLSRERLFYLEHVANRSLPTGILSLLHYLIN